MAAFEIIRSETFSKIILEQSVGFYYYILD